MGDFTVSEIKAEFDKMRDGDGKPDPDLLKRVTKQVLEEVKKVHGAEESQQEDAEPTPVA